MRPRADLRMSFVRISDGRSSALTISIVRPMLATSTAVPACSSRTSSWNRRPTRSACGPSTVISLPRTWICVSGNAVSTSRSNSSRWPSSDTIRWLPGTRTFTWDGVVLGEVDTAGSGAMVPLPRGPTHGTAAEDVQVEVRHGVAGLAADVDHEPVAQVGLVEALGGRHLGRQLEDGGQIAGV